MVFDLLRAYEMLNPSSELDLESECDKLNSSSSTLLWLTFRSWRVNCSAFFLRVAIDGIWIAKPLSDDSDLLCDSVLNSSMNVESPNPNSVSGL